MKKNKIRLTETLLHRIIKESVKSVLKEDETQPYYEQFLWVMYLPLDSCVVFLPINIKIVEKVLGYKEKVCIFVERIKNLIVFIDMIPQKVLEAYLKLPIAEQRRISKSMLTETNNNNEHPDIESAIVQLDVPIEEFMRKNEAVRLSEFEEKIYYSQNGSK